jgi:hypothetical protein
MDELGFPRQGDPEGFARAFFAVTRERSVPTSHRFRRREREDTDDLGLPSEGDPSDVARAFLAVRDHRQSAKKLMSK